MLILWLVVWSKEVLGFRLKPPVNLLSLSYY